MFCLNTCSFKIRSNLRINLICEIHLLLETLTFSLCTLTDNILISIGIFSICLLGLVIVLLPLSTDHLKVLDILTSL